MPVSDVAIPYASELASVLVGAAVSAGYLWNKQRRLNSRTDLEVQKDEAATHFVSNLMTDHRRLVEELKVSESSRTEALQKIGALTTEVSMLRDQMAEIRSLVNRMTEQLESAENELQILRVTSVQKEARIENLQEKLETAQERNGELQRLNERLTAELEQYRRAGIPLLPPQPVQPSVGDGHA